MLILSWSNKKLKVSNNIQTQQVHLTSILRLYYIGQNSGSLKFTQALFVPWPFHLFCFKAHKQNVEFYWLWSFGIFPDPLYQSHVTFSLAAYQKPLPSHLPQRTNAGEGKNLLTIK